MKRFEMFVAGVCVGLSIAVLLSATSPELNASDQRKAVQAGHAEFVSTPSGGREFRWKPIHPTTRNP